MEYQDIQYQVNEGAAWITINRPRVYNAFRARTCDELIHAFNQAGYNNEIGVIVLTGAGEKAFCTGGDQSAHDGNYDGRGLIGLPVDELHSIIRDVPKPVIARVHGYAIGGGNVLAALCDLTICSESAIFGQVGPSMGSVDPGYGTAYLARLVGEKKAREMWYLCHRYSGQQAVEMGLANLCVADAELDDTVTGWCAEIMAKSPTALMIAKKSFNADTESIRGIGSQGFVSLKMYYSSDESKEGIAALSEKRQPDFRKFVE